MFRSPPARATALEDVTFDLSQPATLCLYDGRGRAYYQGHGPTHTVTISGALGHQVAAIFDDQGVETHRHSFRVDCQSEVIDPENKYARLLMYLKKAMWDCFHSDNNVRRLDGRAQRSFVLTSRDHVHGIKAMKYFHSIIPSWIDTFADHQAEDGMIWDFCSPRNGKLSHFENRWGEKFHKVVDNGWTVFARQPMMNDVEYMFIHGVWSVWKVTGDDDWMARRVENALGALRYATTSPYTWSEKFQLVKRTFTIDLWDFQSEYDAALVDGDAMQAIPGVSQYGVMFGDNLGLAQGCDYIAEMLEHLGRDDQAREVRQVGQGIRKRLDQISWNGEHFTMFVPEDATFERDFGVDTDKQVSLSNSYALNRGITHDQAAAIIKTYQRIREETRDFAPAEWSCCYPPFPRGFGNHSAWHYVNGGVSPMVAGELARGALEHGFEAYGWDIIDRVLQLGDQYDRIPRVWRGKIEQEPDRGFTCLDLRDLANTDFDGTVDSQAIPWTDEGDNDLHEMPVGKRRLAEAEFDVIDPAENDRKACVGISARAPYHPRVTVSAGQKARSIYFLHTMSGGPIAGTVAIRYADGTSRKQFVMQGEHIAGWWTPRLSPLNPRFDPVSVVAWTGANAHTKEVGVIAWGLDNPEPDKEIEAIELEATHDHATVWMVLAISLSDAPVWFRPSGLSGGIPDVWSCGAVVYALMEGLAGITDQACSYEAVRIAPRWSAGLDTDITACAKLVDTGGYVRYRWRREHDKLTIHLAASTDRRRLELLCPAGTAPQAATVDGEQAPFETRTIESSTYACLDLPGLGARRVELTLTDPAG